MKRIVPVVLTCAACAGGPEPLPVVAIPASAPIATQSTTMGDAPLEAHAWPDVLPDELVRGFAIDGVVVEHVGIASEDRCLFVDVGVAQGVLDADLALYDDGGALLASDRAESRLPAAAVCVDHAMRVHAIASVSTGAGEIAIRMVVIDRGAEALRHLVVGGLFDSTASPLAHFATRVGAPLERRGFTRRDEARTVSLEANLPTLVPIAVRAGECISVVARPRSGALHLELDLPEGSELTRIRDAGTDRDLAVEACADADGSGTIRLVATGDSDVLVLVSRGDEERVGGRASLRNGH